MFDQSVHSVSYLYSQLSQNARQVFVLYYIIERQILTIHDRDKDQTLSVHLTFISLNLRKPIGNHVVYLGWSLWWTHSCPINKKIWFASWYQSQLKIIQQNSCCKCQYPCFQLSCTFLCYLPWTQVSFQKSDKLERASPKLSCLGVQG